MNFGRPELILFLNINRFILWVFRIIFIFLGGLLCSASLYALDYYGAGRVFEDNKKTHVKVKISTEGASREEFAKNTKKKLNL